MSREDANPEAEAWSDLPDPPKPDLTHLQMRAVPRASAPHLIGVRKVSNWHQALSDAMIANPDMTVKELAILFDKTPQWISMVKNSDAFREYHAGRRDATFSRISETVKDKVTTLSEMSLDVVLDKVEKEGPEMPVQTMLEISKLALNAMGFGGRGGGAVNVQVNNNNTNNGVLVTDGTALARAREKMAKIREKNDQDIVETRVEDVAKGLTVAA